MSKSPEGLPLAPRAIYTSSGTATFDQLRPDILDDYQLLAYGSDFSSSSYKASKYCGDIVMAQVDLQLSNESEKTDERPVRVFTADPGCVRTSIFDGGFGTWALYASVMKFFYWLTFYFVSRWPLNRLRRTDRQGSIARIDRTSDLSDRGGIADALCCSGR